MNTQQEQFPAKVGEFVQLSDGRQVLITSTRPANVVAVLYKYDRKTGQRQRDKKGVLLPPYEVPYHNPADAMVCEGKPGQLPTKAITDAAYLASFAITAKDLKH